MGFTYGRSTNWAISLGGSAGFVAGAGLSGCAVTLLDVDNQIFFPGVLAGSSVGAGLKAGLTVSTFSPTFFTVAKPMYASDFDNSLCGLLDLTMVIGAGGSLTGLTIYGVPHSPSVLSVGGGAAGLAAGLTLSPLLYLYISDKSARQNAGCPILPSGPDPMCGGQSKLPPNQSVDPGMSVGR
jgi:hypothetical protein